MNRIDQKFVELKKKRKKALIPYITAGYPSLKTTEELVYALEEAGADIIELGVPFSDPLADGPTIQASSQEAIKKHTSLVQIMHLVQKIRKRSQVPLALMTYYNPVFFLGDQRFIKEARAKGVDGVIIPDLPPEEARAFIKEAKKSHLSTIFFLSPTTTLSRMKANIASSTGFIYYVSITGVTGERTSLPVSVMQNVKKAKSLTKKPICVGFGISSPAQVAAIAKIADGVIVGSAIIKEIAKNAGNKHLVQNVARFVSHLKKPLES